MACNETNRDDGLHAVDEQEAAHSQIDLWKLLFIDQAHT